MSVFIAEVFGQRVQPGVPIYYPEHGDPCPYTNNIKCTKVGANYPICAIYDTDNQLYLTCPKRSCATNKNFNLSTHQLSFIQGIVKHIFPNRNNSSTIFYNTEVTLGDRARADLLLQLKQNGSSRFVGPSKALIEFQVSGGLLKPEYMRKRMQRWLDDRERDPAGHRGPGILLEPIDGVTINNNGTWVNLEDQLIRKSSLMKNRFGKDAAIVACTSISLFKYIQERLEGNTLPDLKGKDWDIAILAINENKESFAEETSKIMIPRNRLYSNNFSLSYSRNDKPLEATFNHIPISIDEEHSIYTNCNELKKALLNPNKACYIDLFDSVNRLLVA